MYNNVTNMHNRDDDEDDDCYGMVGDGIEYTIFTHKESYMPYYTI